MSGLVGADGRTPLTSQVHVYVLGQHATVAAMSREQLMQVHTQACAAGHPIDIHELVTVAFAAQHLETHDAELDKLHKRCARLEEIIKLLLDECDDVQDLREYISDELRHGPDEALMPTPLQKPDPEVVAAQFRARSAGGAS